MRTRFRLRFLLQELDLVGEVVHIGRSDDCEITINDPLASRHHARILVGEGGCEIEDMDSTNGVRVNGSPLRTSQKLRHGDRIRIGKQEFVFVRIDRSSREERPTGHLLTCHACMRPYVRGVGSCPHCGAAEEVTMDGLPKSKSDTWKFGLIGEVVARAIEAKQAGHANKVMSRAAAEIEARDEPLSAVALRNISQHAAKLAVATGTSEWLEWALDLHQRYNMVVSEQLAQVLRDHGLEGIDGAREVLQRVTGSDADDDESLLSALVAARFD